MAKVVEESLHICHILLPKLLQHFWNLVPRLEWEPNEGYRREPGKVNEETSQKNGRGDEQVNERNQDETDQLHVRPEHHGPVGDQAVGVDHPWQAEKSHRSDYHTGHQRWPGPDADKGEGKEKAKGEEDDELDQEDAEENAPEGNHQGDKDNTEPATVKFGIVQFPELITDCKKGLGYVICSLAQYFPGEFDQRLKKGFPHHLQSYQLQSYQLCGRSATDSYEELIVGPNRALTATHAIVSQSP